jgi:molecular chaperone DnaJ
MREALALLGLSPSASLDDVKRAYRERIKEVHPDLHPEDPQATEKAVRLTKAFEMLTKPQPEQVIYQRPTVVVRFYGGYVAYNSTSTSGVYGW